MRKFATLAALTLCATAGASTASAHVNIASDGPGTTTNPAAASLDFVDAWCYLPGMWSVPLAAAGCTNQVQQ